MCYTGLIDTLRSLIRLQRLRGQRPTRATMNYINSLGRSAADFTMRTPSSRIASGSTVMSYCCSTPGSPLNGVVAGKPPRSPPRTTSGETKPVYNLSSAASSASLSREFSR